MSAVSMHHKHGMGYPGHMAPMGITPQQAAVVHHHHQQMLMLEHAAMVHAAHNGYGYPHQGMAHPHVSVGMGYGAPTPSVSTPINIQVGNRKISAPFTLSQDMAPQSTPATQPPATQPASNDAAFPTPTPVKATPSRHLNYSSDSPVSMAEVNKGGSAIRGGETQPHQRALNGAAPTTPHYGRRLERELQEGTKEDLVKLLLELSISNPDVNKFIESKAQLFALRQPGGASLMNSPFAPTDYAFSDIPNVVTPVKPLATVESLMDHPSTATKTPASPLEELSHDLQERHVAPEHREFSVERHPCLRMYSHCRYPASCMYKDCPRNLCLNFLRGECTNKECTLVHRIPSDASQQILHMVAVCRGETVVIADQPPSPPRELFNASSCSDVANVTLEENQVEA
jgi:hypothetical protein